MKTSYIIAGCSILFSAFMIIGCGGEKLQRPSSILSDAEKAQRQAQIDLPTVPSGGTVAGGVKHYICPNGHDGADAQGNCVICGAVLQHNQAFHDQPAQQPTQGAEPPQNAAGVWHYICPNGHDGGAGSAVACTQCGATLVHNTAYHNGAGGEPTDLTATPQPATPPAQEPPQNAAGVWHYICPNGHAGGGGGATPCPECGATLVHNPDYHNS